jgi:hypothetical protein
MGPGYDGFRRCYGADVGVQPRGIAGSFVRLHGLFLLIRSEPRARKPGMHLVTSNVVLALSVALAVSTTAADAQAANFGVEARAITGGTPGSGATYVGPLMGQTSAHAASDPAATQWTYNVSQQLYSDAAAETWTDMGSLVGHAYALADVVKATNFPTGVTATSTGRFTDRFKVVSDTLPLNAPVTLTFHNVMHVDWTGVGLYEGTASCVVQVNGTSATAKWSAAYNKAETSVAPAVIVVKTTVGATVSLDGRLNIFARGWFFVPGPRFTGNMEVDATCDSPFVGSDKPVQLVAESGFDYTTL